MSAPDVADVHVLSGGRALCDLPGIPREWPAGSRWVRIVEASEATCVECRRIALLVSVRMAALT